MRTLGMQKMGKHEYFGCCGNSLNFEHGEEMIVWVLSKLSEFKKIGKMNSLGVVGTLGLQKMGKNNSLGVVGTLLRIQNGENIDSLGVAKLSEFKQIAKTLIVWMLQNSLNSKKIGKHE